jgi:hypothetical protein
VSGRPDCQAQSCVPGGTSSNLENDTMYTETITQRLALGAGIPPQSANNSTLNTDAINLQESHRAFFIVSVGNVTAGGSVACYLQESSNGSTWPANGTASPFSNSGGTQTSQTGITASNTVCTFEVRADQLSPGAQYVRLQVVTSGSQNVLLAVAAYGDEGNHKPNNEHNATAVTTQNVVT